MEKNITTPKHLKYFVERCKYWQDLFSLKRYTINFLHADIDYSFASFKVSRAAMYCVVTLCKTWDGRVPTELELDRTAFHEISELMLVPLRHKAFLSCNEADVEKDTHEVIRTLENTVFELLR